MNMRPIFFSVIAVALISISGCATTPLAPQAEDDEAKSFVVPDGQANLYVTRHPEYGGSAGLWKLYVDARYEGSLAIGTYQFVQLDPGTHTLTIALGSDGEWPSSHTIEVEAGKSYFFEGDRKMGWTRNRVEFIQLTEGRGRQLIEKRSLAQ